MNTHPRVIHELVHKKMNEALLFECAFTLAKHGIKKNSRQIHRNRATGKAFIGKSKDLQVSESFYINQFWRSKHENNKHLEIITQPIWMIALFEMKKENKTDLSNLYQIVEDCLQATKYSKTGKLRSTGAGVIKDDHQIKAHDWSRIVIGDETKLHLYLLDYEKAKGLGFIR